MVYAADSPSTAQLEILVHVGATLRLKGRVLISIEIPQDVEVEELGREDLPGWDDLPPTVSQRFGSRWLQEARTAILIVPSRPALQGRNVLINPLRVDRAKLKIEDPIPFEWDERLFKR